MMNKNRKFNIICRNIYTICKYIKSLPNILSYMNFGQIYPSYDIDNSEHNKLVGSTHSNYISPNPISSTNIITNSDEIYFTRVISNQDTILNQKTHSIPDDTEQINSNEHKTNNIKLRINLKVCQTIDQNNLNNDTSKDDEEYYIID